MIPSKRVNVRLRVPLNIVKRKKMTIIGNKSLKTREVMNWINIKNWDER
jgi:hypothetical protein